MVRVSCLLGHFSLMRHIIILRNFSNQLGFKETNLPLSHTPSSLSSPSLTHMHTPQSLSSLSLTPPSLSHTPLFLFTTPSPYLCLFTYAFLPMFILPASTYLHQHTYVSISTHLPIYINTPPISTYHCMSTYHHLPTYINT